MKARCLFRFSPFGLIYESYYDVDTGLIPEFSEDIFKTILEPKFYNTQPPFDEKLWPRMSMEQYLFETTSAYLVVDFGDRCFHAYHDNGAIYTVDKFGKGVLSYRINFKWYDRWKVIGYAPTVVTQFAGRPYISEFAYDKSNNRILLNTGFLTNSWFNLPIDASLFSEVSHRFEGYKDCVAEDALAVVYIESKPLLMFLENKEVVLKEITRKEDVNL